MRRIQHFILVAAISITPNLFGQTIPDYKPQNITINVPIEMMGVSEDILNQQGDYYVYTESGMMLLNNKVLMPSAGLGFTGNTSRDNPFGTISIFWYGYQTGNVELLRSLLTPNGQAQLDAANYFDNFSEKSAAVNEIDSIWFLAAIAIDDGVMVFTENKKYGIERNFLRKVKGAYVIEPLNSEQYDALIQNVILYLFYNPKPYKRPNRIQLADSVSISERSTCTARVAERGKYLILARTEDTPKPIFANVKDDSPTDRDQTPLEIAFPITLSYYLPKGENEVYVVESNYPISFITQRFIDSALLLTVKVK